MLASISYRPIPIFEVGPLNLSLHGLFAGVGFAVGAWVLLRDVRRRGFDVEKMISVLSWALVGALLGARFFTVPAHIGDPGYGIGDAFSLAGDYSILGGYAGGIIAGAVRARMVGMPLLPMLDMAAPGLAVGAVIGRLGDLAIVEHLGSPTSFFLGYAVKPGYDVSPQHNVLECTVDTAIDGICGIYHHTALYDMIGAAVLLGLILLLRRAWIGRRYGQMFSLWVIWYGFQRFLIDFTRLGAAQEGTTADSVMGPFTGSQWGALAAGVAGIGMFLWFRARSAIVTGEHDAELRASRSSSEDPSREGVASAGPTTPDGTPG